MELLVLTGAHVRACVDMATAIDLMEEAFAALSDGRAVVPVRTSLQIPGGVTLVMPGSLRGNEEDGPGAGASAGAKIVSVVEANARRGLPAVHAAVVLVDPVTGVPSALMDGTVLTALRTGAASGLATRRLAREEASVLAVFGAGAQARTQIEAVQTVRTLRDIRIVSRGGTSARRLAAELEGQDRTVVRAMDDHREALRGADIVVTATTSATPVFSGDLVEAGAHVNAVGAYTLEMREVDGTLVARSTVVVDSREAARAEAGDLAGAVRDGSVGADPVAAELGDILLGRHPGRRSADEITLFESLGSAAQDMVVAARVLEVARARGMGTTVEL